MEGKELRAIFGQFATGVTVVCTADGAGARYGITVNSFSSLSLDPPLALFSLTYDSDTLKPLRDIGKFSINILSHTQTDISNALAKKGGSEKMAGIPVTSGRTGVPVVEGCIAFMECELFATYEGGDHIIIVGKILDAAVASEEEPLLYFRSGYRTVAPAG